MPRSALEIARAAVYGDRQRDYGHPLDNHSRTASLWLAYLKAIGVAKDDATLTPEQVCALNILQKVSRSVQASTLDTWADIAGFAENVVLVEDERERRA